VVKTKQKPCPTSIAGVAKVTLSGSASIDGKVGTQAPKTKSFEFGKKQGEKLAHVSGSHEGNAPITPGDYDIFTIDSADVNWKIEIDADLYRKSKK
jgi:hypothetical protein